MKTSQLKINIVELFEKILGKRSTYAFLLRIYLKRYLKSGVIFIHIPKAAGTAVSKGVIGRRAGHFSAIEVKNALGKSRYEKLFSFAITRNPYDRVVSAYEYARQGGTENGGIRKLSVYKSKAFSSFDLFVQNWLVHQDLNNTALVFRPQFKFLYDNEMRLLVDYVGKFEELSVVEKVLSQKLQRYIIFEKSNVSQRVRDYRTYFNDSTREMVYDLYREDFEYFNYPK